MMGGGAGGGGPDDRGHWAPEDRAVGCIGKKLDFRVGKVLDLNLGSTILRRMETLGDLFL